MRNGCPIGKPKISSGRLTWRARYNSPSVTKDCCMVICEIVCWQPVFSLKGHQDESLVIANDHERKWRWPCREEDEGWYGMVWKAHSPFAKTSRLITPTDYERKTDCQQSICETLPPLRVAKEGI